MKNPAARVDRFARIAVSPRRAWLALGLLWLGGAAGGAWLAGETARADAAANLSVQATAAADLHAAVLRSELEKHRSLPLVLAADPDVRNLLTAPDAVRVEGMNQRLEALAEQTRAAVIYVLDADGMTHAASNWRLPISFVGTDYGFRPYFIDAMRSGQAEFFALGTLSGRPGLYLARRVDQDGRAIGVVVAKLEFDALEAEWRASGEPAYVVNQDGVVLITSVPEWRFRTVAPLDDRRRRFALGVQTLGKEALNSLPFKTPEGEAPSLVRASVDGSDGPWMHARKETATPGWTLHLMTPTRGLVEAAVANARVLAILLATLAAGVAAVLLRRRQQASARQRAEEHARQELERRIEERTRELRDAEAGREKLRDELVQANKLATLGQIAAGVAHEINQPVAAIRTQAETTGLHVGRGDLTAAQSSLKRIGDLTQRIGAITQELRAFSRKSGSGMEAVDVRDAVGGALLLLSGRLRQAGVRLDRPSKEEGLRVRSDRFRLEQVIVNLVQNAIEAMEGQASPRLSISVEVRKGWVDLVIADNGPGLAPEAADQLFTPFVTTKANGLGLGLVICRDIVAGFGGELNLRPTEAGATFVVSLRRV